jgi:membrane protease subunit HflK
VSHAQTPVPLPMDDQLDAGQRSLSEALRTSFKLLKYVMIVLVVLYLASGIRRVQPNQKGVVLRFGKIVRYADPGWVFAFPFPIDDVIIVEHGQVRRLDLDTFWFAQPEQDRYKPLDEVQERSSLKPGIDGYMFMGDRALLHALFTAQYQISDVRAWVTNVYDEEALVRALLEDAVVATAAEFRAVEVRGAQRDAFLSKVQGRLQAGLDALDTGIQLVAKSGLVVDQEITPPIAVRPDFRAVTEAESNKLKAERDAQKEATSTLNEAAGAAHVELLALIEQYEAVENAGDDQRATELRGAIDSVLVDEATGEAARVIDEARAYRTRLEQGVKADLELFRKLRPELVKNPDIVLDRLWKDALMEVLSEADGKYFLVPGEWIWLKVAPDPEWERQVKEEEKEARKKAKETAGESASF